MTDWTDHFDQDEAARISSKIVDDILNKIHKAKLSIHSHHDLTLFELSLLYRWPIFVGVNQFIERLLRVACQKRMNFPASYPKATDETRYYINTVKSIQTYYYDFCINYNLLRKIAEILDLEMNNEELYTSESLRPQDTLNKLITTEKGNKTKNSYVIDLGFKSIDLLAIMHGFKYKIHRRFLKPYTKRINKRLRIIKTNSAEIIKPKEIADASEWFDHIFPFFKQIHFSRHNFSDNNKKDSHTREQLKRIFNTVFLTHIMSIVHELDTQQSKRLSKLFGKFIDNIISLSIIEGLKERFDYYQNMLTGWTIEYVHSFTGYFYSDNFKVFALLARRKGAKFVGQMHGINNYHDGLYRGENELRFVDYFCIYGFSVTDSILNIPGARYVKFIPTGTTEYNAIQRWNKFPISMDNFTLLYPSGPLMDFMTDLQEISTEKHLEHRQKVLDFLDQLLTKYSGLRVLYKPFPGTYTNDPIKSELALWLKKGKIELTSTSPKKLYSVVDLVLWDSISTGFGESAVCGVPMIVFNSKYEYEQVSPQGKIVNDALTQAGVQCFNTDSAIRSFDRVLNSLDEYRKISAEPIQMFMEDYAMPVSKKEWHRRYHKGINE